MKIICSIGFAWMIPFAVSLYAGEPSATPLPRLVESYLSRVPLRELSLDADLNQAHKIQMKFVEKIGRKLGAVVGYKAGLTSRSIQNRFGVTQPLRGVILKEMLLKSGATLPSDFAAVPMCEGDLMVRVGSEKINRAITIRDALDALDSVIPFIEIPDMVFAKGVHVNASMIVATNVGARYGVMGKPIPLSSSVEWINRLRNMTIAIFNRNNEKIDSGQGNVLLGHPLNVVLWIRDSLKREGKKLKKGDLLSLGALTGMIPVKPDSVIRARYEGLDPRGPVEIFVKFE